VDKDAEATDDDDDAQTRRPCIFNAATDDDDGDIEDRRTAMWACGADATKRMVREIVTTRTCVCVCCVKKVKMN